MSHPEPALVDVRTLAEHPLVESGSSALRMVAPGSATVEEMTVLYARHDQVMVDR